MTNEEKINNGWSASEIDPSELVDDEWIRRNTIPGKKPSKTRLTLGRFGLKSGSGLTRDQMRRIAERTGYPYVEAWSAHNKGSMKGVWGAMVHHTGTSWATPGDYPTLRVVRDGRPGLENSLCAFGLGRSGKIYLVNDKLSWHAGAGNWNGMTDGNGYTVGIEAESDGKNWTPEERDAYPRLVASILVEINQDDRYTTRHGSYALPAGRKTDTGGLDMNVFWNQVYAYLAKPETINKNYRAPSPVAPVVGAIRAAYDRFGGARLGQPKGPELPTHDPAGRWQDFQYGAIYWHPNVDNGTAHVIFGEILHVWRTLGHEFGLGYPVSDEATTPDKRGAYSHFTGGSIYFSIDGGTHALWGPIRDKWASLGWENGLGYPVSTQAKTPDGEGEYTHFQRGSIYFHPHAGAHAIHGEIRDRWAAAGWENGLGYPTTDVEITPDGKGRYTHFTGGASIYHSPESGTHVIDGEFKELWAQLGWEQGFGYPTMEPGATPDGKAEYVHFTGNRSIYSHVEHGTHPVSGIIREVWEHQGWETGVWGYPTSGPRLEDDKIVQEFENGKAEQTGAGVNFTLRN